MSQPYEIFSDATVLEAMGFSPAIPQDFLTQQITSTPNIQVCNFIHTKYDPLKKPPNV